MLIKNIIPVVIFSVLLTFSCQSKKDSAKNYPSTGSVESLDPRFYEIINAGTLPEILADGFIWSEGPVWLPEQNMLLFSDIPNNVVFQWDEKGGLKEYLKPSGYTDTIQRGGETGSNGLLLNGDGMLVLCQHGDRRMARMDAPLDEPHASFTTLADKWEGRRFNSPNDATFDSKGNLFFTDPAYGMEFKWDDPGREINFAGVYKRNIEGEVFLLIDSIPAPNGIGLSPDETRIYVASSGRDGAWYEYKIAEDGSLYDGKVFFDGNGMRKTRKGSPDGLVVREDGIIFATGPGGVLVFDPKGNHLGTVLTGQATANCTLDAEGNYLYMTAHMFLMRIALK